MKLFMTNISIPDSLNVLMASDGEHTIGSPITLKLVFRTSGHPVSS